MFVRPLPGLSQLRSLIVEEWKSPSGFVVKRTGRRTAPEPPRTTADPRVPSASPSLSRETGAPGGAPGGGSVRGSPAAAAASRHRQSVAAETEEVVVVQGGLRGRAVGLAVPLAAGQALASPVGGRHGVVWSVFSCVDWCEPL